MGCLCSRELATERRLADEIEAVEILRQVEQKKMSDNVVHLSSLEYILAKISGRNRVRFYNSLDRSVYLWIYEDPDHLHFTEQMFDARLKLPVVNLELGGSVKRERPPCSDPPIQAMVVASGVQSVKFIICVAYVSQL